MWMSKIAIYIEYRLWTRLPRKFLVIANKDQKRIFDTFLQYFLQIKIDEIYFQFSLIYWSQKNDDRKRNVGKN